MRAVNSEMSLALVLLVAFSVMVAVPQTSWCAGLDDESIVVDITLPATNGTTQQIRTAGNRLQVFCFLGCECPLAKLYAGRLNQLATEFAENEVQFFGINSNPQDSMDEVASFSSSHDVRFPMLKDHDGKALAAFNATRTPEVIAIDERGTVIYRGRIDDQYRPGVAQAEPTRHDLREAIVEFLGDRPITVSRTQAAGCLIAKSRTIDPNCDVTFCGQVAEILRKHCVECHRDGEIGPFALTDYEEVIGWGDMILEVIDQKRMPPWHASSDHEPLINERQLPPSDRELLGKWVAGGMPFGDANELTLQPTAVSTWQLAREPDVILDVCKTPFRVAAEGIIDYQYFVVDPKFEEDTWVQSAEILPGNRSVLHHAIAFIRPPDGTFQDGLGMLAGFVPGQRIAPVIKGLARRVPKGSKIVFQMHYTPTGTEQFDASRLGLLLVDESEVTHESISTLGINHDLEIPPHAANAIVEGESDHFPDRATLLAISPHMHLRGKSVTVSLRTQGKTRTILEVPHYDFNWQHTYLLKNPIELSDGDSIHFQAAFDNSENNPFNPDPSQFVTWGDQTFEEMAVVFYELSKPIRSKNPRRNKRLRDSPSASKDTSPAIQQLVDQFIKDLDKDGDGLIQHDEVEMAVRWRLFNSIDRNWDRVIDREEALKYIMSTR